MSSSRQMVKYDSESEQSSSGSAPKKGKNKPGSKKRNREKRDQRREEYKRKAELWDRFVGNTNYLLTQIPQGLEPLASVYPDAGTDAASVFFFVSAVYSLTHSPTHPRTHPLTHAHSLDRSLYRPRTPTARCGSTSFGPYGPKDMSTGTCTPNSVCCAGFMPPCGKVGGLRILGWMFGTPSMRLGSEHASQET